MFRAGGDNIGGIFLGSDEIVKAYQGSDLVFDASGGEPVVLPYDAKVEYLESSGTQYIALSFGFDKTDEVYMNMSVDTSMGADKYMVSPKTWNNNRNRFAMGVHSTSEGKVFTPGYGSSSTTSTRFYPATINDGNIHQWRYKEYVFEIIDLGLTRDVSAITFGGTTANLKLFYGYNANTKGKISYYKHVKNGITVIELIPVRVGQVGYMYDKVSGELFGNSGTGSFTLGNDIT